MAHDDYFEIHVWHDSFCTIVDFEKVPFDNSFGGKFEYIEYDNDDWYEEEKDINETLKDIIREDLEKEEENRKKLIEDLRGRHAGE